MKFSDWMKTNDSKSSVPKVKIDSMKSDSRLGGSIPRLKEAPLQ